MAVAHTSAPARHSKRVSRPAAAAAGGKPADVPAELWAAIVSASRRYGVNPYVLAGIWRVETGSTYPNPYVNSIGYGGAFGTRDWNGPIQGQADLAASILARLLRQYGGNLARALSAYSGGGYSSVPGYSGSSGGTGTGPGGAPRTGGGTAQPVSLTGTLGGIAGDAGKVLLLPGYGLAQIFQAAGSHSLLGTIFGALFPGRIVIRGAEIVGGFTLIILGLVIIARGAGGSPASQASGAVKEVATAVPVARAAVKYRGATTSRRVRRKPQIDKPITDVSRRLRVVNSDEEIPF